MNKMARAFQACPKVCFPLVKQDLPFDKIKKYYDAIVALFQRRKRSGSAFYADVFGGDGCTIANIYL